MRIAQALRSATRGRSPLVYLFYNLALWLVSPLLLLWAAYRTLAGTLPGLPQRFGLFSIPPAVSSSDAPLVWLHAVSLGEARLAGFVASKLRRRVPGLRIAFTSSTRTGYEEARRNAASGDVALYPPADYAWVCRRFLRRLRPALLVVFETELWPNLFREAKRAGAGLFLVNGRISDRALPRYRATTWLWRSVLAHPDALFAQSPRDAERLAVIGAPQARLRVGGNLKYALPPSTSPLAEAMRRT